MITGESFLMSLWWPSRSRNWTEQNWVTHATDAILENNMTAILDLFEFSNQFSYERKCSWVSKWVSRSGYSSNECGAGNPASDVQIHFKLLSVMLLLTVMLFLTNMLDFFFFFFFVSNPNTFGFACFCCCCCLVSFLFLSFFIFQVT